LVAGIDVCTASLIHGDIIDNILRRDRGVCEEPDSKENRRNAGCSRGWGTGTGNEKTPVNGDKMVCYAQRATNLGLVCGRGNDDRSGRNGDDAKNEYDFG
jgi:hypothetical protein